MMPKAGTLRIRIAPDDAGVRTEILPPPGIPIQALVHGKSAEEVATIIPLVFNVCAAAQETAVRSALQLPVSRSLAERVRLETVREHAIKLLVVWPLLVSIEPDRHALINIGSALKDRAAANALRQALFASVSWVPQSWPELQAWMQAGETAPARTFKFVYDNLDPDWGRTTLPLLSEDLAVDWQTATQSCGAVDNGTAGRVAHRPLMNQVEAACGRGILWRMSARLIEMDDLLRGNAQPVCAAPGMAPAARGTMMVQTRQDETGVRSLQRLSPTDFALVAGGAMEQALGSLPARSKLSLRTLARLVVDTIDPCVATELEMANA